MEYYTPEEAANKLKLARRTVYRWLREGRIKGRKMGQLWRIPESELNRLLGGEQNGKE